MAKIAVIGLGYVGITTAVGMGQVDHDVIGYDINQDRVVALAAAKAPIHEDGLEQALGSLTESGKVSFTNSYQEIADFEAECFFYLRSHSSRCERCCQPNVCPGGSERAVSNCTSQRNSCLKLHQPTQ
jgi:UDPglucose 6-dehydrogenase